MGLHIGSTSRIQLKHPFAAVMRTYVKFLWPLLLFITNNMQIATKSLLLKGTALIYCILTQMLKMSIISYIFDQKDQTYIADIYTPLYIVPTLSIMDDQIEELYCCSFFTVLPKMQSMFQHYANSEWARYIF